jgi:hypothetical protein
MGLKNMKAILKSEEYETMQRQFLCGVGLEKRLVVATEI